MKSRRYVVHSSCYVSADFFTYVENGSVIYVVDGKSLPVSGEVNKITFIKLLKKVKAIDAKKGVNYPSKPSKPEPVYNPDDCHYSAQRGVRNEAGDVYKAFQKITPKTHPMGFSEWNYNYLPNC